MALQSDTTPLVAIVGETASGKSALALELAQLFGGEIIAADSRTIYQGMDIGTAKPTAEERALVPHHLLDVVTPDEAFAVADFKRLTEQAIRSIVSRGHVPFLVGGSGLYVDAVLYDFSFGPAPDPEVRRQLAALGVDELQALARERGIPLPENARNPRHLLRAIETGGQQPAKGGLRPHTVIMGLETDREVLQARVTARIDAMMAAGIIDEVREVGERYGWAVPALQAPGYKAFGEFVQGASDLAEARQRAIWQTMQLAKRQRTWFRRNKSIHWIREKEQAVDLLTTVLSK